ncbi:STAS/SEC14 domain-containing protein [Novipirellula sp. SH528]|uniref:STAS/SEC14 domain-containing protein n=1 Tax=Novipirellula sp. SH528 TaxID=3454466 RepID=UPI003FA188C2
MLKHKLLLPEGILILEPSSPLEADEFEAVPHEIDPFLAEHDALAGVMVFAKALPGGINLEAAFAHLQLIESYHQKIKKLAVVSNNVLLAELPRIVSQLVHPNVRHFCESEYEDALNWLRSSGVSAAKKSIRAEPVGGQQ